MLWKSQTEFFWRNSLKIFSSIWSIFEIAEDGPSTIDKNFFTAQLWVLTVYLLCTCRWTVKDWLSLHKISLILFHHLKRLFSLLFMLFMVLNFCLEGLTYFVKKVFDHKGLLVMYGLENGCKGLLIMYRLENGCNGLLIMYGLENGCKELLIMYGLGNGCKGLLIMYHKYFNQELLLIFLKFNITLQVLLK